MTTFAEYKEMAKILLFSLGTISLVGYTVHKFFDFGVVLVKRGFKAHQMRGFIKKSLTARLREKVNKQISNGKYIPDTFVEVGEIKEKLRYFCDPALFIKKELGRVRSIRLDYFNEKLSLVGMKKVSLEPPISRFSTRGTINYAKVDALSRKVAVFIEEQLKYLQSSDSNLGFMAQSKFENIVSNFNLFHKQVLIITDDAGQGKTNLVCDFADNFLCRKNIPTVFLLGHGIISDNVEFSILNDIAYQRKDISYLELREVLSALAKRNNSPFVIIIDGLNENLNSKVFAQRLERFVEELIKEPNAKLILTCRPDFFKDVFPNISKASFSSKVAHIPSINIKLAEEEREALVRRYFKYFGIQRGHVSKKAIDNLTRNFLLLRIFCEVNRDKTIDIINIYKVDLFRRYLEMKSNEILEKVAVYADIKIDNTFKLKQYLHRIASFMLEEEQFAELNIGKFLSKVCDLPKDVFTRFIDESLIFKRDSRAAAGEVFGFTFDEFRDFVIADYILTLDAVKQKECLDKFLVEDSPIFEGTSRFIFYLARETKSTTLCNYFESQKWFPAFFASAVFEIPDDLIGKSDIILLKKIFRMDVKYSSKIIVNLLIRFEPLRYKTLAIQVLFDILSELPRPDYEVLVFPVFRSKNRDYSPFSIWPIDNFVKDLTDILAGRASIEVFIFHQLFEFLLFLRGIGGINESEVRQLLTKYSRVFPEESEKHLARWGGV